MDWADSTAPRAHMELTMHRSMIHKSRAVPEIFTAYKTVCHFSSNARHKHFVHSLQPCGFTPAC